MTGTICAYHGAITFLTFNIKENQLICSAGVALSNYWEQPPNQIDVSFQSVSMTFNSLTNSVKAQPSWIFSSSSLDYRLEWELKHIIHTYPYNDGYMYIWWEYVSVTFPPLFIMTYSHLVGIWRVGICWVTKPGSRPSLCQRLWSFQPRSVLSVHLFLPKISGFDGRILSSSFKLFFGNDKEKTTMTMTTMKTIITTTKDNNKNNNYNGNEYNDSNDSK